VSVVRDGEKGRDFGGGEKGGGTRGGGWGVGLGRIVIVRLRLGGEIGEVVGIWRLVEQVKRGRIHQFVLLATSQNPLRLQNLDVVVLNGLVVLFAVLAGNDEVGDSTGIKGGGINAPKF